MEIELRNVKYASLCLAIIGLFALALLLPSARSIAIGSIGKEHIGSFIVVRGTIENLKIRNGNAFFELRGSSSIPVVYFRPEKEQLPELAGGAKIELIGKVSSYRGKLQIIAQKVRGID